MFDNSVSICRISTIFLIFCFASAIREEDLITDLPNVTFRTSFKQYSGYLNANTEGTWRLFYWLTESTNKPEEDPLIIWFNGGPACSSLSGALTEYGPYFVNRNGTSLYENIYSWNKYYNVLFLESPIGTGFSYSTEDPLEFTGGNDADKITADQNFHALVDLFLRVQPKYRRRNWFLAGESYAGIYITTLSNLVLRAIQSKEFPNSNFGGFAIGNGYLNSQNLTNSLIHWSYYHGAIGVRQWSQIKETCCNNTEPIESCDFKAHIFENTTDAIAVDECGEMFVDYLTLPDGQNPYNYYLDCYKPDQEVNLKMLPKSNLKRVLQTANLLNYDSTDNQLGFNCFNEDAMKQYLNRKDVQAALHIADDWQQHKDTSYAVCNDAMYESYVPTYTDTFDLFGDIIKRVQKLKNTLPNFRMLIFNGDVDVVCNFLGDSWHMDNVANKNGMEASERVAWKFRDQTAGYVQQYVKQLDESNQITLDVLTVKGAGHFISDRPGPALQMIVNFVRGTSNYSSSENIDTTPATNDLIMKEEPRKLNIIVENHAEKTFQLWLLSLAILAQVFWFY